ncbi:unnamed protein product [Symbiodinium pilosum]|uniref:Uncharacterized protein n=1 Tax=Symbiodinium pilosum TaxID=2952 RepID=A0A812WD39_SYMPI|nr:unnamed protein product [Symbiodinium pilosum]
MAKAAGRVVDSCMTSLFSALVWCPMVRTLLLALGLCEIPPSITALFWKFCERFPNACAIGDGCKQAFGTVDVWRCMFMQLPPPIRAGSAAAEIASLICMYCYRTSMLSVRHELGGS